MAPQGRGAGGPPAAPAPRRGVRLNVPRPPQRLQLRRAKGWRKPEGVIVVARPTRWGNPFTAADAGSRAASVVAFRGLLAAPSRQGYPSDEEIRTHLAGFDLACWCAPEDPCHADVLLEIANEVRPADRGDVSA